MPARSKSQRRAMAIAEHNPEELYQRNQGLLHMSPKQLHEFSKTKEKGLPQKASPKKQPRRRRKGKK